MKKLSMKQMVAENDKEEDVEVKEVTGDKSWIGIRIRKGNKEGKVIRDRKGAYRVLTVQFDDCTEEIAMNNKGKNPQELQEYEWFCEFLKEPKWLKF